MPQTKTFIGYIYDYGLQEYEGHCFFTNVTVCEGTDMDSLIEDFKKKNPDLLESDFSRNQNGSYSYWGMAVCFIPINTEGMADMLSEKDLIGESKNIGNPFA